MWGIQCANAHLSIGTFQVTVSGGCGNTTQKIYIGPFLKKVLECFTKLICQCAMCMLYSIGNVDTTVLTC